MKLLCFYERAEDDGCRFDNLTIYNTAGEVDNHPGHFVGSYCGANAPHLRTFMDSVMMIFKTDVEYAYSGFEIQYYAIQSKKNHPNT